MSHKESGRYDLPIALGILAATGQIPADKLAAYEYAGELALTGELRPIRGALAMTYRAAGSGRAFILPELNAAEAALVENAVVYPAKTLLQVAAHLTGRVTIQPWLSQPQTIIPYYPDMSEVKGQEQVKRALEIAATGGHSVLMVGPPGTGKSMLAERFPGILPKMTEREALESAALQSLDGCFDVGKWKTRPYRAPHHTASSVALVGGGSNPRPGEISMALHGVLFLDELPEFDRSVLEALREPLESGHITISRAARRAEFPAQFQLIAAMNPCPCGYLGHYNGKCRCTPDQVARYRSRISGPLLDRIDIQIEVPAVPQDDLLSKTAGEASVSIQARVEIARRRQLARQQKCNAQLSVTETGKFCTPDTQGEALLKLSITRLDLSARAYHRVLKLARSIADLAGSETIKAMHIAEAVQYRRMDKN
jgi:magnesium chelatase family protein